MLLDRIENLFDPPAVDAEWCEPWRTFAQTLDRDAIREREARGAFPLDEFRRMADAGVTEWIIPRAIGGKLEWSAVGRMCARFAEVDIGATLCFGGAVLGGLPVALAGSEAQQRQYFEPLRRGEMGALALSEWGVGSDLNACATTATQEDGGWVLTGEKAPINNGAGGANIVVLARTHASGDAFASSLFLLARDQQGLGGYPKIAWIGTKAMDLSGATLQDAHVGDAALLGKLGEGFVWVRRTLEISRSGVASMALGAAARALHRGLAHARERSLYGKPIGELDGVRQLLGAAAAKTLALTALGRFALHAVSEAPQAARAWSGAAKLVCTRSAEEVVATCGTVLGARSLIERFDFEDLRRNVSLLPIFDGSSQLQLDELWRFTSAWKRTTTANPRALWTSPHGDLRAARDESLVTHNSVPALLDSEPTLRTLAAHLAQHAGALRELDQAMRFEVSEIVASLHTFAALYAARAVAADPAPIDASLAAVLAEEAPQLASRVMILGRPGASALSEQLLAYAPKKLEARDAMYAIADDWLDA